VALYTPAGLALLDEARSLLEGSLLNRRAQGDAELVPYNRCHGGPEDLYGVQHFLVGKRRDTHLECDAGDAAENFVHIKDLFRDRFSVADQQRAGRSTQGVELSARGGWPAAFLADFGKCVRIAWIEYFRGFVSSVCKKTNGMKTYRKSLGRMTGATPSLTVEVYERSQKQRSRRPTTMCRDLDSQLRLRYWESFLSGPCRFEKAA